MEGAPRAAWCETDHGRGKTRDGGRPEATGSPVFVRRSALLFLTELDRKVETNPGRFWRLGGDFYDNNNSGGLQLESSVLMTGSIVCLSIVHWHQSVV